MTKEDYINDQIESCERRKKSFQAFLDYQNAEIEKVKNISDEEFDEILSKMKKDEEEFDEEEKEMIEKLKERGMSLDDLDNYVLGD